MVEPLLIVAGRPLHAVELAAAAGVLILLVAVVLAWRATLARTAAAAEAAERSRELEARLAAMSAAQSELAGRLHAIADVMGERQSDVQRAVTERLDSVTHRLGQSMLEATRYTTENLARLNERLAVLDAARHAMGELSGEVGALKAILGNKQARGAFGQARMEAIVRDGLPAGGYEFQPTLSNAKRPDCAICLPGTPERLVVDAKFPLEGIVALREADTEAARKAASQRLRADVLRHVDDIASKYLLPGETQDMALLFVPSESVFAELQEGFDDVVQKAFRARVVLVSPSLLMMAVQVMQALQRDQRMRDEARAVQIEVAALMEDVRRLAERAQHLEKHFAQTSEDVAKLNVSAAKILKRGARIEAVEVAAATAGPTLLRPAAE
jgi:DNA recombination protein RmuC